MYGKWHLIRLCLVCVGLLEKECVCSCSLSVLLETDRCMCRQRCVAGCVCVCVFCLRECASMHVIFPSKREVSLGVLP